MSFRTGVGIWDMGFDEDLPQEEAMSVHMSNVVKVIYSCETLQVRHEFAPVKTSNKNHAN
jgi:hypothetical protein